MIFDKDNEKQYLRTAVLLYFKT